MFVLEGFKMGSEYPTPRDIRLSGEDNKEKKEIRKRRKDLLTISYKE